MEIEQRLSRDRLVATYHLGHDRGGDIAWLYEHGEVLERTDDEDGANLTVRLSPDDRNRFEQGRFDPRTEQGQPGSIQ
jgi:GTP-binding protein HflX